MAPLPKRTLRLGVLVLGCALALSACANSSRVTTGTYAGESGANAPYLNVGPLVYEVQLSRELNPWNNEDAQYLHGLSAAERKLEPGQEWFGVFLQVYNHNEDPMPAARNITIYDTQGNVYNPVPANANNAFLYQAKDVPGHGQLPEPGTSADAAGAQGELLLFKIQIVSLDNRPIEIKIVDPEEPSQSASAELDV